MASTQYDINIPDDIHEGDLEDPDIDDNSKQVQDNTIDNRLTGILEHTKLQCQC